MKKNIVKKILKKDTKGITLIALVITIVILIILAGVLVNLTLGDNGLFTRSKLAKIRYEYAAAKEIVDIKLVDIQAECMTEGEEYTLDIIADRIGDDNEISTDIIHFYATAKNKSDNARPSAPSAIRGMLVSANQYPQFKFLIGKEGNVVKVLGITTGDIPEEWPENGLPEGIKTIEKFEEEIGANVVDGTSGGGQTGGSGNQTPITPPVEESETVTATGDGSVLYLLVQKNTKTTLSVAENANATYSVGTAIEGTTNSDKITLSENILTVANNADTTDIITLDIKENNTLLNKLLIMVEPTIISNGVTDVNGNNPQDAYGLYNENDLARFREIINCVDNTKNAKVMAENGIDLISICRKVDGTIANDISWTPIGIGAATEATYRGIFDGNGKKIKNLYINSNIRSMMGIFASNDGTIKNVIMENEKIYNYYGDYACSGGVCGVNQGNILNCASLNGEIKTFRNSSTGCNVWAGGIVGLNQQGNVRKCYNNSVVQAYNNYNTNANAGVYNTACAGGIASALGGGTVENCYNLGTIYTNGRDNTAGGIVGSIGMTSSLIKNCYNKGEITYNGAYNYIGGVCGQNGYNANTTDGMKGTISNCYYLSTTSTYAYYEVTTSTNRVGTDVGKITNADGLYNKDAQNHVTSTKLKDTTTNIDAFKEDINNINQGYPILDWQ